MIRGINSCVRVTSANRVRLLLQGTRFQGPLRNSASTAEYHTSSIALDDKTPDPTILATPEPVPALSYAFEEEAYDDAEHPDKSSTVDTHAQIKSSTIIPSSTTSASNFGPPDPYGDKVSSRKGNGGTGGGGNGSGGKLCPKCGSLVVFQHGDFEENTFYCANCSGWFLSHSQAGESSDFMKNGSAGRSDDPQHMMHQRGKARPFESRETENATEETVGGTSAGTPKPAKKLPTPAEICRGLDEYVIGQRSVKIALSVGVHNHYKRIGAMESQQLAEANRQAALDVQEAMAMQNHGSGLADLKLTQFGKSDPTASPDDDSPFMEQPDINSIAKEGFGQNVEDCELDKSNIIMIGPTGSGKTLLVKTLAKMIDVPLVVADATCLTQAGYVGEDVESVLFKLYLESGRDIERCQRGIVYLDEVDKIRKSSGNVSISRDVSGEGVQHALLKIVEGSVVNVPKEPGRKNPKDAFLQIDTTNILFVCGGAYSGLERIINRRMDAASIGFGAQMKKELDDHKVQGQYFDKAIPRDLVDFGMIPEFVGRFPVIVSTKGLDISNLMEILTTPKNSLVKQYKFLMALNGVNFHVSDCGLEEIAKTAFARGTGARGLRSITENVLMETMFVVPSLKDVHTVYLDAAAVRGDRKPMLLTDKDMTVEKYEELVKKGQLDVEGASQVEIDQDLPVEENEDDEAA